jgi:hypothetical protein
LLRYQYVDLDTFKNRHAARPEHSWLATTARAAAVAAPGL